MILLGQPDPVPHTPVEIPWLEFIALRQFRSAVLIQLATPGHVTKAELNAIETDYQNNRRTPQKE